MSKIKVMNEVLTNKIAAGEVIERPLSVVKELVENSLDAKSSIIKIELIDSGIKKIIVEDNGSGIEKEDLPLAIKRHATSKLYTDKDLFKISTLGFRGEALPSIYAVSQVSIASSVDGVGGSKLEKLTEYDFEISSIAMNKGTKIIVDNLFYNTPVRYKHLSNPFYELSLVVQYINKLSLIHSNISFNLINNGNELISTAGNGDIKAILSKQYSLDVAKGMISFKSENEHFKVEMFSSHPHETRSRKSHITIGINDRLVKNYLIENKIIESYGTFLHTGQYPISFINISVNYSLIDVNIHPTKQQVKISLIDNLLSLIETGIKGELQKLTYMAEPTNIKADDYSEYVIKQEQKVSQQLEEFFADSKIESKPSEDISRKLDYINSNKVDVQVEKKDDIFKLNSDNVNHSEDLFDLESGEKNVSKNEKLPLFTFVGTLHNTYIICENGSGLYLIDQHAAQERINYEIILNMFKNHDFKYQQTLIPIVINLSEGENILFKQLKDETENFGFKVEEFGLNSYKVTEVDTWISNRNTFEEDINEIIHTIIEKKSTSFEHYYNEVAISMACKKSIKAHQRVNQSEAEDLLFELNKTRQPYTCPHGRPVIVKITTKEIEKMFKRVF